MTQAAVDSLVGIVPIAVVAGVTLTIAEKALKTRVRKESRELPTKKKVSKTRSEYVSRSKVKGQVCYNCEFFKSGTNTCEIVKGKISPRGWSKFWEED